MLKSEITNSRIELGVEVETIYTPVIPKAERHALSKRLSHLPRMEITVNEPPCLLGHRGLSVLTSSSRIKRSMKFKRKCSEDDNMSMKHCQLKRRVVPQMSEANETRIDH